MNIEQIKLTIDFLEDRKKFYQSFLLPIFTGIVLVLTTKNFSTNTMYLCLCVLGIGFDFFIFYKVSNINKQINSLINQLP